MSNDLCPNCAYELADDVHCYECGYDVDLDGIEVDQVDDGYVESDFSD